MYNNSQEEFVENLKQYKRDVRKLAFIRDLFVY